MEASKTILQMKYARVVELFARLSGMDVAHPAARDGFLFSIIKNLRI